MADFKPIKVTDGGLLKEFEQGDVLPIEHGGTGKTSKADALTALLPEQSGAGSAGKALISTATGVEWGDVAGDTTDKVDKTTTITAGAGLTGGGDLSANRTLSVKFGDGEDEVLEGNDPRIEDAYRDVDTVTETEAVEGDSDDVKVWTAERFDDAFEEAWSHHPEFHKPEVEVDLFKLHPKMDQGEEPDVEIYEISGWVSEQSFIGGCYGPDGKAYSIDSTGSRLLEVDPITDEITMHTLNTPGTTTLGTVLWGKFVYGIPSNTSTFVKVDITTKQSSIHSLGESVGGYFGGVVGRNGKIYCIPRGASTVLVIDPATDTASTFGVLSSSATKWLGGGLGSDGRIYSAPDSTSNPLIIDPNNESVSVLDAEIPGSSMYFSSVAHPNGIVYGVPCSALDVIAISPDGNIETFPMPGITGLGKWMGGVVVPTKNQEICFLPWYKRAVGLFDPASRRVREVRYDESDDSSGTHYGGVVTADGSIVCFPSPGHGVLRIKFRDVTGFKQSMLSAYYNKL